MEELTKAINNLTSSVQEIKNTVKATESKVDKLTNSVNAIVKEQELLRTDIDDLYEENNRLKVQVDQLEQYSRKANIVIKGIPPHKDENLYELVKNIGSKIEVNLKDYDIIAAHRLPSSTNMSPIIVRLLNYDKKSSVVQKSKKAKLNTAMLGLEVDPPNPIYIDEHLTPQNAFLLKKAQELRRDGTVRFVWTKDGKILLRVDENSPVTRIYTEQDILSVKPKVVEPTTPNQPPHSRKESTHLTRPVAANTRAKNRNAKNGTEKSSRGDNK